VENERFSGEMICGILDKIFSRNQLDMPGHAADETAAPEIGFSIRATLQRKEHPI